MRGSVPLDPTRTGREARVLEETLRRLVVGQEEAIQQIVNIYQMHLTGMTAPGRPVANFLFLGPTGTGKTRVVEATSEALVGHPRAVTKIDCAEFQHSHEIAKLIGSPPGYLGHRETHPLLSQETINMYCSEGGCKVSFILFDEIEKASDALWNLLLGILDKATLTLGDNRKVDFSRCMIFMTSNLGAAEMSSIMSPKMGFASSLHDPLKTVRDDPKMESKIKSSGLEAARRKFTPEFMNRMDKVVVFRPLGEDQLRQILDIELNYVQRRIFDSTSNDRLFVFTVAPEAKNYLLEQGVDPKYGARHLKRAIERILVQPMSNLIATGQVRGGDWIKVGFDAEQRAMSFHREAEGMPYHAMAELATTESVLGLNAFARPAAVPEPARSAAKSGRRS